jgi:hypothetical protein
MKSKKSKRVVPVICYNVKSFKEYELIAELPNTKKLVFTNLVDAISESIHSGKKSASIFMMDSDHIVSLDKSKWKYSLEKAIEFYSSEGVEDYEMCQECLNLIDRIDNNVLEIEVNERPI